MPKTPGYLSQTTFASALALNRWRTAASGSARKPHNRPAARWAMRRHDTTRTKETTQGRYAQQQHQRHRAIDSGCAVFCRYSYRAKGLPPSGLLQLTR